VSSNRNAAYSQHVPGAHFEIFCVGAVPPEVEVTAEKLRMYRSEEHIGHPIGYSGGFTCGWRPLEEAKPLPGPGRSTSLCRRTG
jgi:hypothetical protein